jgi:hypothetical protein
MQILAAHKSTAGLVRLFDVTLWLQEQFFTDANAGLFSANPARTVVSASWNNSGSTGSGALRLPPDLISSYGGNFAISNEGSDWIRLYNYYPGSLRASPDFNRENHGGTPQGPTNSNVLDITSIVVGTNKLTITVNSAHAIQVSDSVTLANTTGTPSANGSFTVSAVPDRTSFEIALSGATGSYGFSGGTVTYTPTFQRYRIWAAIHPNISARIIVSDR